MATRRQINSLHEHAVIDAAVISHNKRTGAKFSVESRPDPPDAILTDGFNRTWIEHTDAFYPGWAEDLTSYAASNKKHRPMHKGLHMDMDNKLAEAFVKVVLSKLNKNTYKPIIQKYGSGILVVGLESPWLDDESLQAIDDKWRENGSPDISSVFQCIYIGTRSNGKNNAALWTGT